MYRVKANLGYRILFIHALLPNSYQKMMNVLRVAKYSGIFCFTLLVAICLSVLSYSTENLGSKRKINLKHINSNDSSNAIQQRNATFDLSRRSVVSALPVLISEADSLNNCSVILLRQPYGQVEQRIQRTKSSP